MEAVGEGEEDGFVRLDDPFVGLILWLPDSPEDESTFLFQEMLR